MDNTILANEFYYVFSDDSGIRLNSLEEVIAYLTNTIGYKPINFNDLGVSGGFCMDETFIVVKGTAINLERTYKIKS